MGIRSVIVDFDDTLCLTEAVCFELENETLKRMMRPPMSREIHIGTWGMPLFEAISLRSPGIDVEEFKEVYNPVIREYIENGKLDSIPQENYEVLDRLIEKGKMIMILTSRTHLEVMHLLELDHLLSSRVKAFFYKDNTEFHKPDPRVFNVLLSQYSLSPRECVYVGDSLGDAEAAKKAGLYFIATLESGLRQKDDFRNFEVDIFMDRFSDLDTAIDRLENE